MSNIVEEIKLYLKHGKFPIIQYIEGDYVIVERMSNNSFITSEHKNKMEMLSLGGYGQYFDCQTIKNNWKIVGVYDIPTITFEVGQKVKVREDLADVYDIDNFCSDKKNMIGKVFTVNYLYNNVRSGLYYEVNGYMFRHEWLLPVLETKRTVDDVLAGLSDEDKEIIMERLK